MQRVNKNVSISDILLLARFFIRLSLALLRRVAFVRSSGTPSVHSSWWIYLRHVANLSFALVTCDRSHWDSGYSERADVSSFTSRALLALAFWSLRECPRVQFTKFAGGSGVCPSSSSLSLFRSLSLVLKFFYTIFWHNFDAPFTRLSSRMRDGINCLRLTRLIVIISALALRFDKSQGPCEINARRKGSAREATTRT